MYQVYLNVYCVLYCYKESISMAHILLVEDNEMNRDMLSRRLRRKGFEVSFAHDGLQSLSLSESLQPDLILMDIQMPHMDGIEATTHIKADANLKDTPIFALTALAMPGDRERCLNAGMDDYFTKPVSLRNLYKKIKATLGA